jgi:signal peptidase II
MSAAQPIARAGRHQSAVLRFVVVLLVLLAADLAVKSWSYRTVAGQPVQVQRAEDGTLPPLPRHDSRVVVPRILALHLTLNRGAVFGLAEGGRWIFVAFSIVATGVILVTFSRSRAGAWVLHVTLAAVLAGALGNLYDRLMFGVVRDMFLLFPGVNLPFGWSWPDGSRGLYPWIFNVADVCLVAGLLVLVVITWRTDEASKRRGDAGRR